jgi:hypothetical protein
MQLIKSKAGDIPALTTPPTYNCMFLLCDVNHFVYRDFPVAIIENYWSKRTTSPKSASFVISTNVNQACAS